MRRALVCAPMDDESRRRLSALIEPVYAGWGSPEGMRASVLAAEQLFARGHEAEIIVLGAEEMPAEVLRDLPKLQLLACSRAGTDNVDIGVATSLGIAVLNTPGRNASAVADFTMALMLEVARKIGKAQAFLRSGAWGDWLAPMRSGFEGIELAGCTAGLIGLGNVGRLVAKRAVGFEMRVLAHDPWVGRELLGDLPIGLVSLELVLTESDFVSIHCALTSDTRGLLSHEQLSKMKPTAYLINTARAGIIDEHALISALKERSIAGAALDVFWQEPLPIDHSLLGLDNVVLTPHIAGAGDRVLERGSSMIVDGIEAYVAGTRPAHLVNPEVLTGKWESWSP